MRTALLVLASLLLAGCAAPAAQVDPAATSPADASALEALEPATFAAPVAIPLAGLGGLGGEPSIAAAPDGTLYVSAPAIPASAILFGSKAQGHVWRSDDGGQSFTLLNDKDGKLAGDACGNGDTDVTVDGMGAVYMADLCGGIPFYASHDKGETWNATKEVTGKGSKDSRDRQWLDARGDGRIALVVAGNEDAKVRSIVFVQSRDAGATWSEKKVLATSMIQIGNVVMADNDTYAMAYVEPVAGTGTTPLSSNRDGKLHVLVTRDGGENWTDTAFERRLPRGFGVLLGSFSPTNIFPIMAADASGNLYLAWSENKPDWTGSRIFFTRSLDHGATWSDPAAVTPESGNAIFPWLAAGSDGRVALAYLRSASMGPPGHTTGPWYLHVTQTLTGTAAEVQWEDVRAVADPIHVGPICQSGGSCLLPSDSFSDRTLLDFFEVCIVPSTGAIAIAYATDPPQEGKTVRLGAVVQNGGTSMIAGLVPLS